MELGLIGTRALVTGATKGIGRAIATALLREGASVAICARHGDAVEAAVAELNSGAAHGARAIGASVDVADHEALRAWVASSAEQLGGVEIGRAHV